MKILLVTIFAIAFLTSCLEPRPFKDLNSNSSQKTNHLDYSLHDLYQCLANNICNISVSKFSYDETIPFINNHDFIKHQIIKSIYSSPSINIYYEKDISYVTKKIKEILISNNLSVVSENNFNGYIFSKSPTNITKKVLNYEWRNSYFILIHLEKDIKNGNTLIYVTSSPIQKMPLSKLYNSINSDAESILMTKIITQEIINYMKN